MLRSTSDYIVKDQNIKTLDIKFTGWSWTEGDKDIVPIVSSWSLNCHSLQSHWCHPPPLLEYCMFPEYPIINSLEVPNMMAQSDIFYLSVVDNSFNEILFSRWTKIHPEEQDLRIGNGKCNKELLFHGNRIRIADTPVAWFICALESIWPQSQAWWPRIESE